MQHCMMSPVESNESNYYTPSMEYPKSQTMNTGNSSGVNPPINLNMEPGELDVTQYPMAPSYTWPSANVPNTPWPSEDPVIVMEPSQNPASLGLQPYPTNFPGMDGMYGDGAYGAGMYGMQGMSEAMPDMNGTPPMPQQGYLPAFLRTLIGKFVRLEFLLGLQTFSDRSGILREVGGNYVVLEQIGSGNQLVCDLYSIKFVNVYNNPVFMPLG